MTTEELQAIEDMGFLQLFDVWLAITLSEQE